MVPYMVFVRANHPMSAFGLSAARWRWSDRILGEFGSKVRLRDQIWIDATSDLNFRLIEMLREEGLPPPASFLIGVSTKRNVGAFKYFNLIVNAQVELATDSDNFQDQLECDLSSPPLRFGHLGCTWGKRQVRPFRF